MSQTLLAKAFGVRDGYDYVRTKYVKGSIEFHLTVRDEWLLCLHCRSSEWVIRKGARYRHLQTVPIGLKPVFLVTEVPRCECKNCGDLFEVSPPLPESTFATPINWLSLCAT